uniref:TIL domain-containing protein n=1 Tax=Strongyloides papillosus TaxID=174720 RepID=A0A0N5B6M7_STREA
MPTCYPVCPGLPKPLCSTETLGPGCICNFPYSINATGNCILRTDCPIRSYPTTTPKPPNPCKFPWLNVECRSACPQTCDEKLQADCMVFCLPSGCQCVYPYLLTHEGECVHNDQCPKKENVKLKREKPTAKPCTGNLTAVSGRDNCVKTCGSTVDYSKCMKKTIGRACICRFPYCLDKNGVCIHERDY